METEMKISEVMRRARFTKSAFGMVLRLDLAGLNSCEDIEKVGDHFSSIVERVPRKSIFGLVDLGSMPVADDILRFLATLTQNCSSHFMGTAIVAPDSAAKVSALWVKRRFNRSNIEIFSNGDGALEWLEGIGLTR